MNDTQSSSATYRTLQQATSLILVFQAVFLFAQLFNDRPTSSSMVAILAATLALAGANRRLSIDPQGQHATGYLAAWRCGALVLFGALTILVALRTYSPAATPAAAPNIVAMLLSAFIALKGAVFGKLKPGGVLGLRIPWTCRSRLAWEKAHRLMGRILFFGGLTTLVASPFVSFPVAALTLGALILTAVTAGVVTSWRVWRTDPERVAPG